MMNPTTSTASAAAIELEIANLELQLDEYESRWWSMDDRRMAEEVYFKIKALREGLQSLL